VRAFSPKKSRITESPHTILRDEPEQC
jgi:hypothetical protein